METNSNAPGLLVHCLRDKFLFCFAQGADRTGTVRMTGDKKEQKKEKRTAAGATLPEWETAWNLRLFYKKEGKEMEHLLTSEYLVK